MAALGVQAVRLLLNDVAVGIGLMLGNYLYQAAGAHDYGEASKLSFFQLAAILCVSFVHWVDERRTT